MKTNLKIEAALAGALFVLALPAMADDFLQELARTDGNVRGEHTRSEGNGGMAAKPTKEQVAFLREMARTDGNVAAEPVETPSESNG